MHPVRALVLAVVAIAAAAGAAAPAAAQSGGYPPVQWNPADPANVTRRASRAIDLVIIHTIEGPASSAVHWFKNPRARASAHYIVDFSGAITQMVAENDIGWHAGNWAYNVRAIGLEHAGYAGQNLWTLDQYRASARLTRAICLRHGIPMDRAHIIGHDQVPAQSHWDPGPHFDWTLYLSLVQSGNVAPTASPGPGPARPDFGATLVAQSGPHDLGAGDQAVAWAEFRNDGTRPWSLATTRLGTAGPRDRGSAFHASWNWTGPSRPTAVDRPTAPGQVGRFTFLLVAPRVAAATTFEERFQPLEEGVTWFGPEVVLRVRLRPKGAPAALPYRPPETWSAATAVEAGGRPLAAPGGSGAAVAAADWDGDGDVDLLVGGVDGTVAFHRNLAAAGLDLEAGVALAAGGWPLSVGAGAAPATGDLDGDARLDLVVGGRDGRVWFYRRTATGDLAAGTPVAAGGSPYLAPGGRSAPFVADLQADGLPDLVVGAADGTVALLVNRGLPARAVFAAAVPLATDAGPVDVGTDARPLAADVDRNGTLDFAVGNAAGQLVVHYDRNGLHAADVAPLAWFRDDASAPIAVASRLSAALADTDGDGLRDLFTFGDTGPGRFWPGVHLVGDLDDSHKVDGRDLGLISRALGAARGAPRYVARYDLDGDGDVDAADRDRLATHFGRTY